MKRKLGAVLLSLLLVICFNVQNVSASTFGEKVETSEEYLLKIGFPVEELKGLSVDFAIDAHTYTKKFDRPTKLTWTGATYKISKSNLLHANYGIGVFSIVQQTGNADPRIILNYVDDTSMMNNTTYTIQVYEILSVSIDSSDNSYREASDMFYMFTNPRR